MWGKNQKEQEKEEQRLNGLAAAFWQVFIAKYPLEGVLSQLEGVSSLLASEAVKHNLTITETEVVLSRVLNLAAKSGTRNDHAIVGYFEIAARMFGNLTTSMFGRVKVSEVSKMLSDK